MAKHYVITNGSLTIEQTFPSEREAELALGCLPALKISEGWCIETREDPPLPITGLDDRERDTILAALRRWQKTGYVHSAMHGPGAFPEWDIATNGGTLAELSYDEIERLCDRLNA